MDGYANLIAARLRRLADEKSTGTLPVSGRGDGAVFFRDGRIVYAESARTSLPGPRVTGLAAPGPEAPGPEATGPEATGPEATGPEATGSMPGVAPGPGGGCYQGGAGVAALRPASLGGVLMFTELVVDAITELLSSESRYAKFRSDEVLPDGHGRPIAVETLLAEVQRRHELLRQLAPAVSPDTPVACESSLGLPSAQVSPVQWALLRRAGDETTPRTLAVRLSRSVFGTTLEVYRLIELGLLVVRGRPPAPADGQAVTLSFIRAVAGGKGSDG